MSAARGSPGSYTYEIECHPDCSSEPCTAEITVEYQQDSFDGHGVDGSARRYDYSGWMVSEINIYSGDLDITAAVKLTEPELVERLKERAVLRAQGEA